MAVSTVFFFFRRSLFVVVFVFEEPIPYTRTNMHAKMTNELHQMSAIQTEINFIFPLWSQCCMDAQTGTTKWHLGRRKNYVCLSVWISQMNSLTKSGIFTKTHIMKHNFQLCQSIKFRMLFTISCISFNITTVNV